MPGDNCYPLREMKNKRRFMQKASRKDIPRWAAGLILAGLSVAAWGLEKRKSKAGASGPAPKSQSSVAAVPQRALARRALRPTWRDGKEIARRVYKALGDDRLLAVAAGIIEQHAGGITVQSEPGKGTEFRVALPAMVAAPAGVRQ